MPAVLGLVAACGPPGVPDDAPGGPRFVLDPTPGSALFDAPFPGVHRQHPGGSEVSDWPNPDGIPYVDVLLDLAAEARGAGTTSGVVFRLLDPTVALGPVDAARSLAPDAPAFVVAVDGPHAGERVPVDLWVQPDGGPFGAPGLVTLLPLQGVPSRPNTTYAAVLTRDLGLDGPLGVPAPLWALAHGRAPAGWDGSVTEAYLRALDVLRARGTNVEAIAGLAVYRTWDPTSELVAAAAAARTGPPPALRDPLALTEVHDGFCVLESTVAVPVYQAGEPPYTVGGGWVFGDDGLPILQGSEVARLWVTVPRRAPPAAGYPVTVMVRTGGGGDRPLVDRGPRGEPGGAALAAGTGPALELARAGHVGVQIDGPHGGPWRNPTGADEQFLMFNIGNPVATRDNVRQSALELALVPGMLAQLAETGGIDATGCPGAAPGVPLDLAGITLLGHSMGATIAPLAAAAAPEFDRLVLSGAGGSYLYNLVYKRSPLDVRPLAEALLGFTRRGRRLEEADPVLQLLQWVSEPADPPPYARIVAPDADVLMVQGVVDTYILPPMANAMSLAWGLDLVGEALDVGHPELEGMRPLLDVLALGGGEAKGLPASGSAVLQVAEDGIEDGHEVLFQTEEGRRAYRCFVAEGVVPAPSVDALAPCR